MRGYLEFGFDAHELHVSDGRRRRWMVPLHAAQDQDRGQGQAQAQAQAQTKKSSGRANKPTPQRRTPSTTTRMPRGPRGGALKTSLAFTFLSFPFFPSFFHSKLKLKFRLRLKLQAPSSKPPGRLSPSALRGNVNTRSHRQSRTGDGRLAIGGVGGGPKEEGADPGLAGARQAYRPSLS